MIEERRKLLLILHYVALARGALSKFFSKK